MNKAEILNLPESLGTTWNKRLIGVYSNLWKQKYGFEFKANYGFMSRMFTNLLEQYNEYQIACLLVVFFDWRGVSGEDEWEFKRVANSAFNITWFSRGINQYEVYLRNVLGVNIDSVESMNKFLQENNIIKNNEN